MVIASQTNGTIRSVSFEDLSRQEQKLLLAAQKALERAYNPYSQFFVGAAILTRTRAIITGANVENAAYGEAICAERSALVRANAQGSGDSCVAVAIVARNRDLATTRITSPCGACRQTLFEAACRSGVKEGFRVIMATTNFEQIVVASIGDLLPLGFGPSDLETG